MVQCSARRNLMCDRLCRCEELEAGEKLNGGEKRASVLHPIHVDKLLIYYTYLNSFQRLPPVHSSFANHCCRKYQSFKRVVQEKMALEALLERVKFYLPDWPDW